MKKIISILALLFSTSALADSNSDLIQALVNKGVLTPEEAAPLIKDHVTETRTLKKTIADSGREEMPIKFYGTIRTFVDSDNVNTPIEQPDARVTNFISKFGIRFKEPVPTLAEGWVVNGQYETQWVSDNPRQINTFIGDQQSTIGLASNYLDSAAEYKIDIGRKPHSVWQSFKFYGIFGDAYGTPLGEIHARQGLFFNNGVYAQYKPSFVPGLTVNVDYSMSEKDGVKNKYVYGAKYDWDKYSVGAYRYDDLAGNNTTLMIGSIALPQYKSKISAMASDDSQTGGPFPASGMRTQGFSTQLTYNLTPEINLLAGTGRRSDGVKAYTLGADYAISNRATIQVHAQHVKADDPIIFTTANDIGPLFGINGGSAAATGTTRTQIGTGIVFSF